MSSRIVVLHLSLIPGAGPAALERIVAAWGYDRVADVYFATAHDIYQRTGLSMAMCQTIAKGLAQRSLIDAELKLVDHHGISFASVHDPEYPPLLKEIHLPPTILYWRGQNPGVFSKPVAFVGSRKANAYAVKSAKLLIKPLAEEGVCVVSGGAIGADTLAHKVAVECGAPTVAIIGAGLLQLYPAQNRSLFETIIAQGGSVVSPFPLGMQALPGNFPARNRIIAGLSKACIVLQAADRSGALITAQCALDYGREVGAVPGHIDDPLSFGCHKLLSQGAHVITSAQDVLDALGLKSTHEQVALDKNLGILPDEESIEATIIRWCKQPSTFDAILEKSSLEATRLHETLFTLQLAGKIGQDFRGLWYASD